MGDIEPTIVIEDHNSNSFSWYSLLSMGILIIGFIILYGIKLLHVWFKKKIQEKKVEVLSRSNSQLKNPVVNSGIEMESNSN